MKITNPSANIVNQAYTAPAQKNQNQISDKNKNVKQNTVDSVSLSTGTKDLQKVFHAMHTEPNDNRADKVEELKTQVDQGRYTVNAEKVAEKMAGYFLNELG